MKKVYEIKKFVLAEDIKEALKIEKTVDADECLITTHSCNLLLDSLHRKNV